MQFIKSLFQDKSVIGLCGLKKDTRFLQITLPTTYTRTKIINTEKNYVLL